LLESNIRIQRRTFEGIERKMNFKDATEKVITIIGTKILKILEEIYPESEFPTEYTHLEV